MVKNRFLMHRSGCAVCGKPLIYNTGYKLLKCYYCEGERQANVFCPDDHFVCDKCHRIDANDYIVDRCLNMKTGDPINLANLIMEHKLINIHGPEHHFLVPAVLLSSYAFKTGQRRKLREWLKTLRLRMIKIPGAICSTHGSCGAILGLSAFVSFITNTTSLSYKEWSYVHTITSEGMDYVAKYGGPRCCKRDTYIALLQGVNLLNEKFDLELDKPEAVFCKFNDLNKECIESKCLFYKTN